MDTISTTYAKAIDELAGKIFVPALICSLFVELGPVILERTSLGFWTTYLGIALSCLVLAPTILYLLIEISIRFFGGNHVGDILGIVMMPLGFAGLFPDYFTGLEVPYTQVTGMALLAWSFMLVQQSNFLNRLRELI